MIKRKTIHLLFATLAACLCAAMIYQFLQLRSATFLSSALAAVPAVATEAADINLPDKAPDLPEVQLAVANALSNGNNLELAELSYNKLISSESTSATGQAARFNLANGYLRQAMDAGEASNKTRTLLELAKQRYRDLLQEAPDHWGARYNLERTLRLAPELSNREEEDKEEPIKRVRVIVPGFEKQDLP